jgi:subtilisin family serine protease
MSDAEEGVVRIKFKRQLSAVLSKMENSRQAGVLSSGITTLDRANQIIKAKSMKRVFPYSPVHDQRHRKHNLDLWYDVYFDNSISPMAAITTYQSVAGENIEVAEPIYKKKLIDGVVKPFNKQSAQDDQLPFNDRLLASQWHYNNTGQVSGAIAEADINLFEAWKIQVGKPEVIVSIVDGGIDINHNDLKNNLWINKAELNGKPGVDDDGNGYIDDIYGVNFITGNGDITAHHHGTHVAGTVAATNNNGFGVCGVAGGSGNNDGARLMSSQVFDESGASGGFAAAIVYGADNGAVISQNSWGYSRPDIVEQSVLDAIDYFIEEAGQYPNSPMKGGIVIFAAGNDNVDDRMYPGYYEKTLCVSALGPNNEKAYYSNYGTWVDIAAPGGDQNNGETSGVLSTLPGNTYGYLQGTSMACPHVSGIAALTVSQFGAPDFTADELRLYLIRSTHDVDQYNPEYVGKLGVGYIDAAMALKRNEGVSPNQITDFQLNGISQDFASLQWTIPEDEDDGYPSNFQIFYSTSPITTENYLSAQIVSINNNLPAGTEMKYDLTDLKPLTTYYFAIRSLDRWANKSPLSNVISGTTNVGPDINISATAISMTANKAGNFKTSSTFSIDNLDEGTLKWQGIMRHKSHQLSNSSKEVAYPKESSAAIPAGFKCNVAARHTNEPAQPLGMITLNDTEESIEYGDGSIYVVGESDGLYTNSSAVKYQVTNESGFNLTHVSMVLNHNPETENMVVEIYKDVLKPSNLIYAQEVTSYTYAVYEHTVQLNEQLYFDYNDIFWIVFHVPQGNPYSLGAQTETSSEYSDNCFMSFDLGKSWLPLSSLIKNTYVWSTRAISRNRYLGEYLEMMPASGHILGNESQDITVGADASKLINGKYQANIVIASNDPDEKEIRLPITLTVTGQEPTLTNEAVVNFGSVFHGLSKDVIIQVNNTGYGDFAKLKATTSDDQFSVIKKAASVPARSTSSFTIRYKPNSVGNDNALLILEDNKGNSHKIRLFGIGTAPAEITLTPSSLSFDDLAVGDKVNTSFTITNSGQYPLDYKLPLFMMDRLGTKDYSIHKFGYSYESNVDGGTLDYNWVDIRNSGKDVTDYFKYTHSDHTYYDIDLGFEFPFFGRNIKHLYLTRFGALTLDKEGPLGTCYPPFLDSQCAPAGVISAMMWAFDINRSGSIHYKKEAGKLTVQFTDVFNEEGFEDEKVTFQIIIYQNGDIDYLYEDIEMMYSADLEVSLMGIGDPDYKDAFVIHGNKYEIGGYTNGHLETNQSIYRIKHPGQNLVESVSKTEGTLGVGESETINVVLNTESLNEGLNKQILSIISNDPHKPTATVHIDANITSGGVPNLSLDRNTINFGTVFRGSTQNQIVELSNSGNKNIDIASANLTGSAFSIPSATYPIEVKAKTAQYIDVAFATDQLGLFEETLTITDENGAEYTANVIGEVLPEPTISVDVDEIDETVDAGELKNHKITITNNGGSPLEFIATGAEWLYLNENVRAASVPEFMYSYLTSKDEDGPVYEWIDITEDGTRVDQSWYDDNEQFWRLVELPFQFKLYNIPTNKIWVSWQGVITTSTPMINPPWIAPDRFPSTMEPNSFIAPYFALQKYNRPGTTNSAVFIKTDEEKVVVLWNNLFDMYGLGIDYSFEAILYKNGSIKFQYKHSDQGWAVVNKGLIGLENSTGTDCVRVAAHQNFFENELAIVFNPGEKKTIAANNKAEFNVALDATNLNQGEYISKLVLHTNTPQNPQLEIPVILNVDGQPVIELPESIDFGAIVAYEDPETGSNKEYMKEFVVKNTGRAVLSFKSITLEDNTDARMEYYTQYRGSDVWMAVPSKFTMSQPCRINPGASLKMRLYVSPSGENATLSTNIVFASNDLPGNSLLPVTATITRPPVASLIGDDIVIKADTPKHKESRSFFISNIDGNSDLTYNLSLTYNRAEKQTTMQTRLTADASTASLSALKAESRPTPLNSASEEFDVVLEYDQAQTPDTYIGLGDGTEFVNATAFNAPQSGLRLTHVKTWYRPGNILQSDIKVYICSGTDDINEAEILLEQSYSHVITKADDKGEFLTIALDKPIVFYPNEKFYVVINYPFNASHPQGAAKIANPVKGRFFFPYDNSWEDVADSELSTYGWMVKAMSDNNEVTGWISLDTPESGTVAPGEQAEVKLNFDAQFCTSEDNFATAEVTTNDPVNPVLRKSISLHINQGPKMKLVQGQSLVVNEGETLDIKIEAADKEGDECTYELVSPSKLATMSIDGNMLTVSYSPDFNSAGTTTVAIKGKDAHSNETSFSVNVEVIDVNRQPELKQPFNTLDIILQHKSTKVDLDDYFTDPDGDAISYSAVNTDTDVLQLFLTDSNMLMEPKKIATTDIILTITDERGAAATHTVKVSVINRVGIDNLEQTGWRAYPNPADSYVILAKSSEIAVNTTIRIFTMAGQTVITKPINQTESTETKLDVSGLAPGIYFIEIEENNTKLTTKLIKR